MSSDTTKCYMAKIKGLPIAKLHKTFINRMYVDVDVMIPLIRRSQNAEKVKQDKGRLLEQAVILINCVPFQIGNFS